MGTGKPPSKTEVCDALYSLNRAVETVLESLRIMQSAGIDFPFLNGHRLAITEMQQAANHGVASRYFDDQRELHVVKSKVT